MADNKPFDDGFWNLDKKYIKPKESSFRPSPYSRESVSAVDITIESNTPATAPSPIPPRKEAQKSNVTVVREYKPDNIFINKVRITTTDRDGEIFGVSNMFMRERAALLHRHGEECPYVGFSSYSPRYSQMSKAQLSYYLWWRENVRRGNYVQTDISYVKLYIMELVTCSDDEDAGDYLHKLCQVSRLCVSNPIWHVFIGRTISDFCLLHMLPCPPELLFDILPTLISEHISDEIFLPLNQNTRKNYADLAISYISLYNYKKSKIYEGDKCELFDLHIKAALHEVFNNDISYGKIASLASGIFSTSLSDRKIFDGRHEFCAPNTRIQVSYYPIGCISTAVTNAIRYAENKLRECLGVRTKLAINDMDSDIAGIIDEYFKSVTYQFRKEPKKAPQKKVATPKVEEYDKLYDSPTFSLSLERAAEIEKASWETTFKLTEAFSEVESTLAPENTPQIAEITPAFEPKAEKVEPPVFDKVSNSVEPEVLGTVSDFAEPSATQGGDSISDAFGDTYKFLLLCKSGYMSNQKGFARDMGMTLDELADKINEIAVDVIGDIIIEECDGGYEIIPDYLDMII